MKTYLKTLTLLVIGSWVIAPAQAQALDEKGLRLKSMIEDMLEQQKSAHASTGEELVFDGETSVEQAGEYYAVTLPYLYIKHPDGSRFDVGLIAINAAPHNVPGQWKMTFALPTPMSYTNTDGQEEFQITIGGQRSSGVWTENLNFFSKLDTNFQNITIAGEESAPSVTIPALRAVYDLDIDEQGKWSGPVYFSMNDILADNYDALGSTLRIGAFDLNVEMFKYDPAAAAPYNAKLENLIATPVSQHPSDEDILGLYDAFSALVGNGFTSEYQLTDVQITNNDIQKNYETVKLENARLGFDLTGFLENKIGVGLRAGFDGLEIVPTPSDSKELAPSNLNLDLAIDNIPGKELAEAALDSYKTSMVAGEFGNVTAMSLLFKLPAILTQSGTSVSLNDNTIGNALYNVDISGKIISDAAAANAATANINSKVKGLDALTTSLSASIQNNPGAPNSAFLQQMLLQLTILKGFAKADTDENGDIIHTLDVILNKQGNLLVNNNDVSALFGGLGLASGAPKTTPHDAPPVISAPPTPAPETETLPNE